MMRPAPLHTWNASAIRGVAFDVDDTLTRNGVVEASAFEALHRLHAAGFRLIAVTGRPLGWAEVIAHLWPVHGAIGENGAGWFTRNAQGMLEEGYFASEDERRAICEKHVRIEARVREALPQVRVSRDARLRRFDLAFDVAEHESLDGESLSALEALIESMGATAVTSSVHCHAALGDWNKHRALVRAAGSFLPDEWVYIGDSANDEAAFAALPHSVGVANVMEHDLKALPRYITKAERGEGFAEFARHLMERTS